MTLTVHEGALFAAGMKVGLVASRFNSFIVERLVEGAVDCLVRHGADADGIELVRVPGTWEMPLAVQWMLESGRFDAIVALGCVIRGGTPHFEYVAGEVTSGVSKLALQFGTPVTLGVLTTESIEQGIERAGTKHGNKGWEAAAAAIEMVAVRRKLEASSWAIADKRASSR